MTFFNCEACAWRVTGRPSHGLTVYIEERAQMDGRVFFAVVKDGWVANTDRRWEYEPIPSSRDDAFIARTRFEQWDDAARLAQYMADTPSAWDFGRKLNDREAGVR